MAKQQTVRVPVDTTPGAPITTGVYAPSGAGAGDGTLRRAMGLSQALGLSATAAEQAYKRVFAKAELAGTQAALTGRELTDKEKARDHFMIGFEKVQTTRDLIEAESAANSFYDANPDATPQDLQAGLDKIYADKFGHLDPEKDLDQAVLRHAAPAWNEITAKLNERYQADARDKVAEKYTGNLHFNVEHEFVKTGRINFDDLHDQLMGIFHDGKQVNKTLATIVTDIGERNAAPELFDQIPDKWADGTPTIKHIPEYATALDASKRQAEAQREHDYNLAQKEAERILKETHEHNSQQLVGAVLAGQNIHGAVESMVTSNQLSSEDARNIIAFQRVNAEDVDRGATNPAESGKIEIGLRLGTLGFMDIVKAVNDRKLGYGQQGREDQTRLMALARELQNDALKTPDAQSYLKMVEAATRPPADPFGLRGLDPAAEQQAYLTQATALRDYQQAILSGKTPAEAAKLAVERAKSLVVANNPFETQRQYSPDEIQQLVAIGDMTYDQAMKLLQGQ